MLKRTQSSSPTSAQKRRRHNSSSTDREPPQGLGLAAYSPDRCSSPELGLPPPTPATPATANPVHGTPSRELYSHLRRTDLEELLRARGVTPQHQNRRNKADYLQRLVEFDQENPDSPLSKSLGQFSDTRLTVRELREALKVRGLSVKKGDKRKKEDLLERLREFDRTHQTSVNSGHDGFKQVSESVTDDDSHDPAARHANSNNGKVDPASIYIGTTKVNFSQDDGPLILAGDRDVTPKQIDGDIEDSKSATPSAAPSIRSSPPRFREPARWYSRSPSTDAQESDADSAASKASSRSQSPAGHGGNSDTDSEDNHKVREDHEADEMEVQRIPSPTPPYIPPSAQREPVAASQPDPVLASQPSPTRAQREPVAASQPDSVLAPQPSPARISFQSSPARISASQPVSRPARLDKKTSFVSASQPTPASLQSPARAGRLSRSSKLFTSLKDMITSKRAQPSQMAPAERASLLKTGSLSSLSPKKKLPDGLDEDSEDENSSSSSSSEEEES